MDMTNIMYELVNTKTSMAIAGRTIETLQKQNRRLNRRCFRQSLAIAGLTWLTVTACRMLSESDEKRKDAEKHARETETELAMMHHNYDNLGEEEKDICCDGKASVTKNKV